MGGTPYNGQYGEAPFKWGIFFRCQVYEGVEISLPEVHERVGKFVILIGEKGPKELTNAFYGFEKVENTFWCCHSFIFESSALIAVKRAAKF